MLAVLFITGIAFLAFPVSATSCSDAGQYNSTCQNIVDFGTLVLAILSVLLTGTNAGIVIGAIITIVIVTMIFDLAKGNNSLVRKYFNK